MKLDGRYCFTYFNGIFFSFFILQYIRELENDLQKLSKYITESEIAENVLKQMKNQLEKNRMANVFLLQAVQREHEQLLQQERDAQQAADARENATPQGESMLSELKQVI
ncbi:hypothetical protein AVEN_272324-1 [Araneus ventricosus]|uniref:Uncharacterized protein n=1 Tax=Araneus ventricosus TaxID=182803 RepID=A0A4Y2WLD1_ARAVE|nr:hypothetical protein AVEN_272324-1 [Araneus ventricosus]